MFSGLNLISKELASFLNYCVEKWHNALSFNLAEKHTLVRYCGSFFAWYFIIPALYSFCRITYAFSYIYKFSIIKVIIKLLI